jgi:hypothetical protein
MFLGQPALSQPGPPTDSISISRKQLADSVSRISTIDNDLSQLVIALHDHDDPELGIATGLVGTTQLALLLVESAWDMLYLYSNMSLAKDREYVRKYVEDALKKHTVNFLENQIKSANGYIALTKKPGIVSSATELKNAIRQAIDVLNAVRL